MAEENAEVSPTPKVVVTVERSTIGQGFFVEPTMVDLKEDDTAYELLAKVVGAQNIMGVSREVTGIKGADQGRESLVIPDYIVNDLEGPDTEIALNYGNALEDQALGTNSYSDALGMVKAAPIQQQAIDAFTDILVATVARYDMNSLYKTHIQNKGWKKAWAENGETSGSEGEALRLEAIQIELTGEHAYLFDVYYQVHAQNIGWMDVAKNGDPAGTEGFGYRLEGIYIEVVPKGQEPFVRNEPVVPSYRVKDLEQ